MDKSDAGSESNSSRISDMFSDLEFVSKLQSSTVVPDVIGKKEEEQNNYNNNTPLRSRFSIRSL